MGELHRVADADGAGVRLLLSQQHAEQGGLAAAVGADDADDGAARHLERQPFIQGAAVVTLLDVVDLDHQVAQARAGRDVQFPRFGALLEFLRGQFLVGLHARLGLGLAALGVLAHPLQLFLHRLAVGVLGLLLLLVALVLLLQPGGVVALPGDAVAAVQFQDPAGDVVEEVAVMGDGDDGAGEVVEELLQPGHRFGVQMVGRLVEQDHVRLGQQQAAQRDAAALAAGQLGDVGVPGRQVEGLGGLVQDHVEVVAVAGGEDAFQLMLAGGELVEIGVRLGVGGVNLVQLGLRVGDVRHCFLDVAAHRLGRVELRLLLQVADLQAGHRPGFAAEFLVDAGHDAQQGRFAGTVIAEHADLGAGKERKRDIPQDLLLRRDGLPDLVHGVDVLAHGFWRAKKVSMGVPPRDSDGRAANCNGGGWRGVRPPAVRAGRGKGQAWPLAAGMGSGLEPHVS